VLGHEGPEHGSRSRDRPPTRFLVYVMVSSYTCQRNVRVKVQGTQASMKGTAFVLSLCLLQRARLATQSRKPRRRGHRLARFGSWLRFKRVARSTRSPELSPGSNLPRVHHCVLGRARHDRRTSAVCSRDDCLDFSRHLPRRARLDRTVWWRVPPLQAASIDANPMAQIGLTSMAVHPRLPGTAEPTLQHVGFKPR